MLQLSSQTAISRRRSDLDWLRVIAFGVLIYFHTAIAFLPKAIPMIVNAESSVVLMLLVDYLHQFRLGLLFLVSGVGVCFAMKHRDAGAFFADRSRRLLMPLAFGIAVLVPPMVYLEKRYIGAIDAGFVAFYPTFFTDGIYPGGHLSWHHFWFLAYLYLFCCMGWPLFKWFERHQSSWFGWMETPWGLWLPVLFLIAVELPLRPLFPGFRDLVHDWASFAHWFTLFTFGFLFARNEPLLDRTQRMLPATATTALATTFALIVWFWQPGDGFSPLHDGTVTVVEHVGFSGLRMIMIWSTLLACLGAAGRYLQRGGPVLDYLNSAVYPLFCLHLPIIVALDYLVLPTAWPIPVKFLVITTGTIIFVFAGFELIRRLPLLPACVGITRAPGRTQSARSPTTSQ